MKKLLSSAILVLAVASNLLAQQNNPDANAPFTCGQSQVTDHDGNAYNTVQIGEQCWMKENLRVTCYSDGTPIELSFFTNFDTPYRYLPHNNESLVPQNGYLYNWIAVVRDRLSSSSANPSKVQGICPNGWHVPSDAEWTQLTKYVASKSENNCGNGKDYIGKALASTTGWEKSNIKCSTGYHQEENDATGFSAMPSGIYTDFNQYDKFGGYCCFWSCTQEDRGKAFYRGIRYDTEFIYGTSTTYIKTNGCSVRCLRD